MNQTKLLFLLLLVLNERIMSQWLNLVWFSHVPNSSLLIADSFQTHTNPVSQKFMVSQGACLAIIPSACSQKLQPLHRGMKMKFKVTEILRHFWFTALPCDTVWGRSQLTFTNFHIFLTTHLLTFVYNFYAINIYKIPRFLTNHPPHSAIEM